MLGLNRFLLEQEKNYQSALNEIKSGKKTFGWMWYIFPQLKGLVKSSQSEEHGIKDVEEAKEYLENETLRKRLIECTQALLDLKEIKIGKVLGYEGLNFKSCMTLFKTVEEEFKIDCGNIFAKALNKFYEGKEDDRTLKLLDKVDFLKIWKKSYTSYINNDEIITDLTINRFITAQEKNYQTALNEIKIKSGKKSHSWIWYIFPQLKDLVKSQQSNNYGIKDIEEAKEYLENETLRKRLIECTQALLDLKETKISKILGYEGSNFKSCMTLFKIVELEFKINCGNIFAKALDKFFDGKGDDRTLKLLDNADFKKILKKSNTNYINNANLVNNNNNNNSVENEIK